MPNSETLRINRIRRHAAALRTNLESVIAWDAALAKAYKERTGQPLAEGQPFTAADAARADEILLLTMRPQGRHNA